MAAFYSDDNDPRRIIKASPEQRDAVRVKMEQHAQHARVREIRSVVGEVLLYSSTKRRFSDAFAPALPPPPPPPGAAEIFDDVVVRRGANGLEIVEDAAADALAAQVRPVERIEDIRRPENPLHGINEFKNVLTVSQGDCMFDAISIALSRYYSILDLRHMWANSLTRADVDGYKNTGCYLFEVGVNVNLPSCEDINLTNFKETVMQRNYYGDEVAINNLSNALHVRFIVVRDSFYEQDPNNNTQNRLVDGSITLYPIPRINYDCKALRYIIMRHGGNHYTLIQHKDRRIFDFAAIRELMTLKGGGDIDEENVLGNLLLAMKKK